jgi:signal transduction histidine kinase
VSRVRSKSAAGARSPGGVELVLGDDAPGAAERYRPIVGMGQQKTGLVMHRALDKRAPRAEQERGTAARLAVAEEHARMARELQAAAVRHRLGPGLVPEHEALAVVERTGREVLTEMRRLAGGMRAEDEAARLAPQPGLTCVEKLVDQVRDAGLPVEVAVEGDAAQLPPGIDLSAYRVVQEGLTNVLRHAGPARARVLLRYVEGFGEVEVVDDGQGSVATDGSGHGLLGIRERVRLCGGELETGPRDGGGYVLRARFPVTAGSI